ncbi:hypothetical protein GCM10010252_28920 [Streptomyces aureoverticillatus]|nr:hypothetical protein GCM10010252_28920 [Streptomyces aureoverticillatus]
MVGEDETSPDVRVGGEGPGAVQLRFHGLERSFPEDDDRMRDFTATVHGEAVRIEVMVRTWGGDDLDGFLAELAEDFRGWRGARTWGSLERDLTLSAEHTGRVVRLAWGLHDGLHRDRWHFELTTEHDPGEEMRNLAGDVRTFLKSEPLGP